MSIYVSILPMSPKNLRRGFEGPFTTVCNLDWVQGLVIGVPGNVLDVIDYVHTVHHLAEDHMFAVKPRCLVHGSDEEL